MDPTGSKIIGAIEDIRMLLNVSSLNAKYDNNYIARTILPRAVNDVYVRSILTSDNPVYCRMSLPIAAGQEYYQLPVAVQAIMGIRMYSTQGDLLGDWRPRQSMDPRGPGWQIEGNMLHFLPIPQAAETWEVWYVPSADVPFHYGIAGTATGTTNITSLGLGTPTYGLPFKFANEPVGQMLRILGSGAWYERVITSYNQSTNTVSWSNAVAVVSGVSGLVYEVVPSGMGPLWYAASARAACELGISLDVPANKRQALKESALTALKTMRDTLSNLNSRVGKGWEKRTIDNPNVAENLWAWN